MTFEMPGQRRPPRMPNGTTVRLVDDSYLGPPPAVTPSLTLLALPAMTLLLTVVMTLSWRTWGEVDRQVQAWSFVAVLASVAGVVMCVIHDRGDMLTPAMAWLASATTLGCVTLVAGPSWPLAVMAVVTVVAAEVPWCVSVADRHQARAELEAKVHLGHLSAMKGSAIPFTPTGHHLTDAMIEALGVYNTTVTMDATRPDGSWATGIAIPPGKITPAAIVGDTRMQERLRAALQVPADWRLRFSVGRAAHELVVACDRIPILPPPTRHPVLDVVEVDPWAPIPLGVEVETGEPYAVDAVTKVGAMCIVGPQGSGKSTIEQGTVAWFERNGARIWLIDGQGGKELGRWRQRAVAFAGDLTSANVLLHEYIQEINRIYTELERMNKREVSRQTGHVPNVLVIDELERLTNHEDKVAAALFTTRLLENLNRPRAAGGFVVWATQTQDGRSLDTRIIAKTDFRFLLRAPDQKQVARVMGGHEYIRLAPAHMIGVDEPGVGYFKGPGGVPKLRSYPLSDAELSILTSPVQRSEPVAELAGPESAEADLSDRVTLIRSMRAAGMSWSQISAATGVPASTIRDWVNRP